MKGLFLDDERSPDAVTWIHYDGTIEWTVARDYSQFVEAIAPSCLQFDCISFDHDLGPDAGTGYDCVRYLVDRWMREGIRCDRLPVVYVHSQNPVGAANIKGYWDSFVRTVGSTCNGRN